MSVNFNNSFLLVSYNLLIKDFEDSIESLLNEDQEVFERIVANKIHVFVNNNSHDLIDFDRPVIDHLNVKIESLKTCQSVIDQKLAGVFLELRETLQSHLSFELVFT